MPSLQQWSNRHRRLHLAAEEGLRLAGPRGPLAVLKGGGVLPKGATARRPRLRARRPGQVDLAAHLPAQVGVHDALAWY